MTFKEAEKVIHAFEDEMKELLELTLPLTVCCSVIQSYAKRLTE